MTSADRGTNMTPKEIARSAGRIFGKLIPPSWAIRSQEDQEDYGIDYEIELTDEHDQATGIMFKVQQKGQLSLDYDSNGKMVKYHGLEVKRLRYYLNNLKLPVVFAVVGVQTEQTHWTVLQGNSEVEKVLRDAEAAGQQTVTLRLPIGNLLPATADRLLEEVERCMDWLFVRSIERLRPVSLLDVAKRHPDPEQLVNAFRIHADTLRCDQIDLLGEQRALHLALGEQHGDLARMYLGTLMALRQLDNPERLPQAAYSIRELMNRLPDYLDVPMPAHSERGGDWVGSLRNCWKTALTNSACRQNATWEGNIDAPLVKLMLELEGFLKWQDELHPRRRDEVAALWRRLDPAGGKLPVKLEAINYKEWSDLYAFFNGILHHGRAVTFDEFQAKLTATERLLLDRLRPRTFADWQTIDDIIREGESHD